MRRTIVLGGVLPFVSAFVGGVLALSLVLPSFATAQSRDEQDVRASAFTLVGPDGTIGGRLEAGNNGNGNLTLYDGAGRMRLTLRGAGHMSAYDEDGTVGFRAGRTLPGSGANVVNGVLLGPGGSIGVLPPVQ